MAAIPTGAQAQKSPYPLPNIFAQNELLLVLRDGKCHHALKFDSLPQGATRLLQDINVQENVRSSNSRWSRLETEASGADREANQPIVHENNPPPPIPDNV